MDDNQYPGLDIFPFDYCHGFFVIISADLIHHMALAARTAPFFWIDDIFLFGLLPHIIGDVTYVNLEALHMFYQSMNQVRVRCFEPLGPKCAKNFMAVNFRPYLTTWRSDCLHMWKVLADSANNATLQMWFSEIKRQAVAQSFFSNKTYLFKRLDGQEVFVNKTG